MNMMNPTQAQALQNTFFQKVYLWMAGALLFVAAASAVWLYVFPQAMVFVIQQPILMLIIMLFVMPFIQVQVHRNLQTWSMGALLGAFAAYLSVLALFIAPLVLVYTQSSIVSCFAIAGGTFVFFSVYGMVTKQDLTKFASIGSFLMLGAIIAMVVNVFFLKSSTMSMVISLIVIASCILLIAFQTKELKNFHEMTLHNPEMREKMAVYGAFHLSISFIILFIHLLNIFGNRR